MAKILKKLDKIKIFNFGVRTVIPFFIPFILEIDDKYISAEAEWIILIVLSVVDLFFIFQLSKLEEDQEENNFKNKIARDAYSSIYELNERKRDYIVGRSYKKVNQKNFYIPERVIPYNVHEYIGEICNSFRNVIAQITAINKEYVSVSFIYRYVYKLEGETMESQQSDRDWRWVIGREQTMQTPLNDFVNQNDTVYHTLLGKDTVIFYNDKQTEENNEKYYMSARDKRHDKIGSIFGVKMMFSNNAEKFVEGILVISTYGKRFIEDNNDIKKINQLKRLIVDDLLPNYQRMLEAEMGILYLRHMASREENIVESDSTSS